MRSGVHIEIRMHTEMAWNPPIVLAVDTSDLSIAIDWVKATSESVSVYKLGLEFFLSLGHEGVRAISGETERDIFLDLKLHDIPHTVASAAMTVSSLRPKFLTVHASGGNEMIAAAVEALPSTLVAGVTILTSLGDDDLRAIGYKSCALESAVALANLAVAAGARAIVCSPLEILAIRQSIGDAVTIITPGVRPPESSHDDQLRTMTPREAIDRGANLVVIGRPITSYWSKGVDAMRKQAEVIATQLL